MNRTRRIVYLFLFAALVLNVSFWVMARDKQAVWANVPPVPSKDAAGFMALSDPQFAYRSIAIMLQNMGDTGGKSTALTDYNYDRLGQWFFLADELDPVSNYIPLLAAFYFGATQKADDLTPVIDYLAYVGQRPDEYKWRWLAQAVYLSRFVQNDYEKALELAQILAEFDYPRMPTWTKQMPAFILHAQGKDQTAYELLMGLIRDEGENLDPAEVNFMASYICERILDETAAAQHPLCSSYE